MVNVVVGLRPVEVTKVASLGEIEEIRVRLGTRLATRVARSR